MLTHVTHGGSVCRGLSTFFTQWVQLDPARRWGSNVLEVPGAPQPKASEPVGEQRLAAEGREGQPGTGPEGLGLGTCGSSHHWAEGCVILGWSPGNHLPRVMNLQTEPLVLAVWVVGDAVQT